MRPCPRTQRWFVAAVVVLGVAAPVAAQTTAETRRSGGEIYRAACSTCHGPDGKGSPVSHVGFTDVELPDFSDCKFSTPEPDADWMATIHLGGPARAFSKRMPSFVDALSDDEIGRVVDHLRNFCKQPGWPRGDLNLPRPFVTEKAFPENESIVTTTISRDTPGAVETEVIYEHRIGRRSQYEIAVPFTVQQQAAGDWSRGLGDVAVAIKHALFDSLRTGSIISAGAETKLPTGQVDQGLGGGVTVAEAFVSASQMLPRDGFLHVHAGFEFPLERDTPNEAYWRVALGKTFSEHRWGRAWSPMMELLAAKELGGEAPQWDVLPQMQVTLSTRQHIMINAGVRIPLNERETRSSSVLVYFLWDWFDGGLFSGW